MIFFHHPATIILCTICLLALAIAAMIFVWRHYSSSLKKENQVSVVENPLYNTGQSENYYGETMIETKNTYYDGDTYYDDYKNYATDTNPTYGQN